MRIKRKNTIPTAIQKTPKREPTKALLTYKGQPVVARVGGAGTTYEFDTTQFSVIGNKVSLVGFLPVSNLSTSGIADLNITTNYFNDQVEYFKEWKTKVIEPEISGIQTDLGLKQDKITPTTDLTLNNLYLNGTGLKFNDKTANFVYEDGGNFVQVPITDLKTISQKQEALTSDSTVDLKQINLGDFVIKAQSSNKGQWLEITGLDTKSYYIRDISGKYNYDIKTLLDNSIKEFPNVKKASEKATTDITTLNTSVGSLNTSQATQDSQIGGIETTIEGLIEQLKSIVVYKGQWNATTNYKINNYVEQDKKYYIALSDNVNQSPKANPTIWDDVQGPTIAPDLGNYYTKSEVDNKLTPINTAITNKQDKLDATSKVEVDSLMADQVGTRTLSVTEKAFIPNIETDEIMIKGKNLEQELLDKQDKLTTTSDIDINTVYASRIRQQGSDKSSTFEGQIDTKSLLAKEALFIQGDVVIKNGSSDQVGIQDELYVLPETTKTTNDVKVKVDTLTQDVKDTPTLQAYTYNGRKVYKLEKETTELKDFALSSFKTYNIISYNITRIKDNDSEGIVQSRAENEIYIQEPSRELHINVKALEGYKSILKISVEFSVTE